jgi:hypothetical protein
MTSSMLSYFSYVLCPQLLSLGSMDVPALLVELTQAQEVVTIAEATHAMTVLAAETSTREAAAAWDNVTLCVKDVEDWASLAEREALEWLSRVEAENVAALASTDEDGEGLPRKVTLLEDELTVEHRAEEMCEREH